MATSGEAEIATRFPVVDGIIARTTTQTGHIMNLEVEDISMITRRESCGLN